MHEVRGQAYVYVERLLSYVDSTPYFSSLYLNMSLGSQPLDLRRRNKEAYMVSPLLHCREKKPCRFSEEGYKMLYVCMSYYVRVQWLQTAGGVCLPSVPRFQIFLLVLPVNTTAHRGVCKVVYGTHAYTVIYTPLWKQHVVSMFVCTIAAFIARLSESVMKSISIGLLGIPMPIKTLD